VSAKLGLPRTGKSPLDQSLIQFKLLPYRSAITAQYTPVAERWGGTYFSQSPHFAFADFDS